MLAAVSLGASVVEKHFTLDRALDGPDHGFALTPEEFAAMVTDVRRTPPLRNTEWARTRHLKRAISSRKSRMNR